MTRKDFIMLSSAIRNAKPKEGVTCSPSLYGVAHRTHRDVAEAIADALARDNRAFDRERFLRDCETAPEPELLNGRSTGA